jgi:iron complex transport system substrate-binding protein
MSSAHLPNRIACLQPSATVILAGLGELDRVVACTKYCADVVPEVKTGGRLIIADSWSAKAREIGAAKPDLVIASVPFRFQAVAEILKAGIRFVALAPRALRDIYTDIATIAGLVAASDRGETMISQMQAEIERVRRATASFPRKRVFCEEWGKPIIASQPWVEELVSAAGGVFLSNPGAKISAGEVAKLNPEVIVAAWCGAGDRVPLEKIIRQRGWEQTIAAKTGQVYCVSDELLNTPASTLVAGLHALTVAIHPTVLLSLQPFSIAIANQKEPRRITEVSSSMLIRKELV